MRAQAHQRGKTEIEGFKHLINLTEYAAAQGYVLDRKASSRNSITMRGPGDDKIIVGRDDALARWSSPRAPSRP